MLLSQPNHVRKPIHIIGLDDPGSRQKGTDRLERNHWHRLGQWGHPDPGTQPIRLNAVQVEKGLSAPRIQHNQITRINQIGILNLRISAPNLWPLPRVLEETAGDTPERISLDYTVGLGPIFTPLHTQNVTGVTQQLEEGQYDPHVQPTRERGAEMTARKTFQRVSRQAALLPPKRQTPATSRRFEYKIIGNSLEFQAYRFMTPKD